MRPNPSFEARPNGKPPGPGRWYGYIITGPGLVACRWSRLNSNVRRRKRQLREPSLQPPPRQETATCRCLGGLHRGSNHQTIGGWRHCILAKSRAEAAPWFGLVWFGLYSSILSLRSIHILLVCFTRALRAAVLGAGQSVGCMCAARVRGFTRSLRRPRIQLSVGCSPVLRNTQNPPSSALHRERRRKQPCPPRFGRVRCARSDEVIARMLQGSQAAQTPSRRGAANTDA